MMMATTLHTRVVILLGCLFLSAVAVARADRREAPPARSTFDVFPMRLGEWQGTPQPALSADVLKVLGASDYLVRSYYTPDRKSIGLYIGYWNSQRQGDTIHSPLNCLPGAGWEPVEHSILRLPDPAGPGADGVPVNRYIIQKGLDRQLVLYWYQSHGRVVASEYWGKLYLVADAVRLNRTDGSIVRIISPIAGNTPEATAAAEAVALRFASELRPKLDAFLPL